MLARYATRPGRILGRAYYQQPRLGLSPSQPRRTFVSLDVLKDGFLDLAIALPIPPSWPAYSTTIILCTVLTRLAFTVPFSVWSKRRQWRAEEEVLPRLQSEGPVIAKRVLEDMQREKARGTKEELQTIHRTRMKDAVAARRKELFAEYHCQPMTTMAVPPLTQLPVFVGCSVVLAHISQHPTPLDSESFLTLSTLIHPDPTAALPIALGFITLANVESSRWFMTDQQREREVKVQTWREERIAKGERVIEPQKIIKSALRLVSVGRILIATMVPGSVVLYWVTSATFGLVQTWIIDYWELRRKRRLAALASSFSLPSALPSSPSPVSPPVARQRRKK
jgi:inner membrane protein COX18